MNSTQKQILLDVGGTFIKCSDGRQVPINSNGSREEIVAAFKEAVGDAEAAAVAMPGPFDYQSGQFLMKHKFAAVYGEYFQDITGVKKCLFAHDVNAMLLGELMHGAGKGFKSVALVTLGTGLGFSMAVDGKLITSELGSPKVSVYNRPYCGGVLEDYVSKRGFLRGFENDGITVKQLSELARGGHKAAAERFEECAGILVSELSPILEEYGIECVLFGGQISRSFDLMAPCFEGKMPACVKHTGTVSDISNATFNGLNCLLES